MGKFAAGQTDFADQVLSGTFAATGQSNSIALFGMFNVALWGTFSGTVALERSFDGGTTWIAFFSPYTGTAVSFTTVASISETEPEIGVLYRLNCTAYTSGTVNYRVSISNPRTTDNLR